MPGKIKKDEKSTSEGKKTSEERRNSNTTIPKLFPKLKLRDLMAMLKLFQPCCFPLVPSSKLSNSRRNSSAVTPNVKSRSSSVVMMYTIKTANGRLNGLKTVDAEVLEVFGPVENEIKEKLREEIKNGGKEMEALDGSLEESKLETLDNLKLGVVSYKTQSVVGLNYFPKILVNDGPVYIHARIYQPVQGEPFLTDLSYNKKASDDIEYF